MHCLRKDLLQLMRIQFYVLKPFRPCKTMLTQLKTGEGLDRRGKSAKGKGEGSLTLSPQFEGLNGVVVSPVDG